MARRRRRSVRESVLGFTRDVEKGAKRARPQRQRRSRPERGLAGVRGTSPPPKGPPAPGFDRPGPYRTPREVRKAKAPGKSSKRYRRARRRARERQAAQDTVAFLRAAGRRPGDPWFEDVAEFVAGGGLTGQAVRSIRDEGLEARLERAIEEAPVVRTGPTIPTASGTIGTKTASTRTPVHNLFKLPVALTAATVEDPKLVASTSLRTAKESVAGIPQGLKMLVEDPKEAVKAIGADYKRRYGPLLAGDTELFKKRFKRESGVPPFALDALSVAPAVGQGARVVAGTGILGKGLETVATAARPMLRTSGGPAGARKQRKSRNLFVAGAQHATDKRRQRKFTRAAEHAGFRPTPEGKLRKVPGRAEYGRLPAVRPGRGEVIPAPILGLGRDAPFVRRLTGRASRDLGGAKSRTRVRILQRQARQEKAINKLLHNLSGDEQQAIKYMLQLGIRGDKSGERELRTHRANIVRERELMERRMRDEGADDVVIAEVLEHSNDELRVIDEILASPEKHLTPRARSVADDLRAIQREEEALDPALNTDQARIRKLRPQAEHLGVERAPDAAELVTRLGRIERKLELEPGSLVRSHGHLAEKLPEDRLKAARKVEKRAAQRKRVARERHEKARRELAAAKEAARRVKQQGEALGGEGGRRRHAPDPLTGVVLVPDPRKPLGVGTRRTAAQRAREAEGRVEAAKRELDSAAAALSAARAVRQEIKTRPGRRESADAFEAKVTDAAEQRALEAPAYWESTIRPTVRSSLRTAGTGGRAASRDKRYTGALFRTGREETDPRVFTEGIMRNIKRRFNWGLVRRNVEAHAFEWSYNDGAGITANQFLRIMDDRAIDPDTVDLVDVRELERRETLHAEAEQGSIDRVDLPEEVDTPTHNAVREARLSREVLALAELDPDHFRRLAQNRYVAVPRIVYDELESATRPGSTAARSLEVVFKSKPSRVLLGLLNVPWLTFQIAANGMLSGLAGVLNPFDYVHGARWWKSLDPEVREAVAPYIGIGYHHVADQPHLGQTSSRFVNAWRAFRQTKGMRGLHKANIIDLFFSADQAQNNFFRKAVFYNQAKKAAADRMGRSMRDTSVLQERMVAVLKRPPEDQLKAIVEDPELFEQHAAKVNEWLGDYVTYSSTERATLGRAVMFYGYLRFSLRFTFYTMPVHHPVMANIFGNLGRMGAQEIKRLLGVPPNFDVPTSMIANMYFGSEREFAKGAGRVAPIGRMNPFLNAVTQMERPSQVFGIFSPLYQAATDQIMHQSTFRGKDWKIGGRPTPPESERPGDYFGSIFGALEVPIPGVTEGTPRGRIFERQMLSLVPPYRMAEQGFLAPLGIPGLAGAQGDDSLLWDQRPVRYKDEDTVRSIRRQTRRERREQESGRGALQQVAPMFFPRPDSSRQILEREMEKIEAASPKRKRRRSSSGSLGSGLGGSLSGGDGGLGGSLGGG